MKTSQNKQTVAVIGAGVVGICTAIELQQAGFKVSLFDKDKPAKQASFGNAAYLAAEYLEPLATLENIKSAIKHTFSKNAAFKITPDHFLKFIPWGIKFMQHSQKAELEKSRFGIRELSNQSVVAWEKLLKLSGNSNLLEKKGYLKLWENPANLPITNKLADTMKASGHDCELFQGASLYELEPCLSPNIKHGLYFPNATQLIDTYEVCKKLYAYFLGQGGEFHQLQVDQLKPVETGVKLKTTKAEYCFEKAVIAAGAWSKKLLKSLGLNVPLAAERGYHLTFPQVTQKPLHILESTDRHVVLSSLQGGMRIVGFGEYGNLDSKPTEKRYQQLKYHLYNIIINDNEDSLMPIETWMGIRPTLPDSLPVIDLHPKYPQIGMVFGHHHLGVTQAAISAQLISALMTGLGANQMQESYFSNPNAFTVKRF